MSADQIWTECLHQNIHIVRKPVDMIDKLYEENTINALEFFISDLDLIVIGSLCKNIIIITYISVKPSSRMQGCATMFFNQLYNDVKIIVNDVLHPGIQRILNREGYKSLQGQTYLNF